MDNPKHAPSQSAEFGMLIDTLNQLKTEVLNLLDDLLEICPREPDILLVRLFFENQIDSEELMLGFVEWALPWKESIKKHDEKYFDKNDHIFGPLPPDKVIYFKKLVKDGTLEPEDKDIIWEYFEVFVELAEKYERLQKKLA